MSLLIESFESPAAGNPTTPTGWSLYGTSGLVYKGNIAENPVVGSQAYKISHTSSVDTGIRYNITGLTSGKKLVLTVHVKTDALVDNANITMDNTQNGSGGSVNATINVSGAFDGYKTLTVTPDSTAMEIFLGLGSFGAASDGSVWYDDLIVQLAPTGPFPTHVR
jgi:hypothetical protein